MTVHTSPAAEPDLLLLHRFIETGDPAIFAEIVQRYARVVYAASLRVLGDEGRAQDVSQETFFRLMQRPRLVTHSLAGWLHRTATHLALDVRRSEKSRRLREQGYGLDQQAKPSRDTWGEMSPFVDQALNELEEPCRGLLIRHFLQGVSQANLAAELDVSPASLSRRIKTGLEKLQVLLQKKGIYVGLAALAGLFASKTQAAVPVALLSEMGKMNLVATLRHVPAVPRNSPPPPPRVGYNPSIFIQTKFAAALIGVSLMLSVYLVGIAASWMRANPTPAPATENQQVATPLK